MQQPPNPEQPYPYQQPTQQPYNAPQAPVPPPPYQYNNYPPQQPIKPRKSKTWLWIVGLILAFLVGRASVTTTSTTATPQTSTASTANQQQAVQPTEAPTKPLIWQTVQTFSGSGNQKTAVFAVSDNWKIAWTCSPDPQANAIGGYYFSVNVDNSDSSISDFGALSGSCKPGNTSTTTNEHQAGNVYLDVTSGGGPWTVTVQEVTRPPA